MDGTSPRVSVLVSIYRRHRYLRLALQSVFAQDFTDYEVVVWNDGGVEMSALVPELEDARVRYHHDTVNRGVLHAVRHGVAETKGELIAHLDDDDEWDPAYLGNQVRLLDAHPSASIAFCDHWVIDADGKIDERYTAENSRHWGRLALAPGLHQPAHRIVLNGTIALASAAVWRRSAVDLEDFPPQLHHAYDIWVSYLATRGGQGVVYEARRLVSERRHPGQIGSAVASTPMLGDITLTYERYWEDPELDVDRGQLAARLAAASANWAVALLRDGEREAARAAARRSLSVRRTARGMLAATLSSLPTASARMIAHAISTLLARWRRVTQASLVGQGSH